MMHPDTGKALGLKEGDSVKISVKRPKGHTYRAGEDKLTEYGKVANSEEKATVPDIGIASGDKQDKVESKLLKDSVWWSKKKNGIGGGVAINDALPINPCPLTGGQNWYDNVCTVEKI